MAEICCGSAEGGAPILIELLLDFDLVTEKETLFADDIFISLTPYKYICHL